jgi:hypothetical protein
VLCIALASEFSHVFTRNRVHFNYEMLQLSQLLIYKTEPLLVFLMTMVLLMNEDARQEDVSFTEISA